jgi:uncharacterized membrane protein (DUF485 family)
MTIEKKDSNLEKKSPKQRFLLVIGIIFFLLYLFLGIMVIFWKQFPLEMEFKYRIAFGVLLIVYAIIRFLRLIREN